MYHFYALLARMRYIRRWSLMVSQYPENVAEHTLMTAVLAHGLALIRRDVLGLDDVNPDECAVAALFHDASEIMTGDLPTPVKYANPEIRAAYGAVETASTDTFLSMLPPELRTAYEPALRQNGGITGKMVHAADKLSAYIKCVEELRGGNSEFREASVGLKKKLEALRMPELDYFLLKFLPSFELTLDELK